MAATPGSPCSSSSLPHVRRPRRDAGGHCAAGASLAQPRKLFLLVIGSPVRVEGNTIEPHYPCVVVANHGSYLDGIILTAALPAGFTYLIKYEMSRVPIAGFILRRLGSAFVDRDDRNDRQRTARALHSLATRGSALGFFPEGTFDKVAGAEAFHLGAFAAAARAKLPVVPVVIHGARWKLPARVDSCRAPGRCAYTSATPCMPRPPSPLPVR